MYLINLNYPLFGFQASFQWLLKKQGGKRSAWEYPFAVAGVNITFMIMQMLDLDASKRNTWFLCIWTSISITIKFEESFPVVKTLFNSNQTICSETQNFCQRSIHSDVIRYSNRMPVFVFTSVMLLLTQNIKQKITVNSKL